MAAQKKKEEFIELFDQLTEKEADFFLRIFRGIVLKNIETGSKKPECTVYTLKDLVPMLGVTYRTLQNWVKTGYLPVIRIGNKWAITETDLLTFIQEKRLPESKKMMKQDVKGGKE